MIDLTPLDVRKKRGDFRRILRGYDPEEVDSFMELVADRFEELVRQNLILSERNDSLESQIQALEGRESAVQEALVSAQKLRAEVNDQSRRDAEVLKEQAKREAELLRGEAEAEIARRLAEADSLVRERQTALEELERSRLKFLKAFKGLLERELDAVEVEESRRPLEDTPLDLDLRGWVSEGPTEEAEAVETEEAEAVGSEEAEEVGSEEAEEVGLEEEVEVPAGPDGFETQILEGAEPARPAEDAAPDTEDAAAESEAVAPEVGEAVAESVQDVPEEVDSMATPVEELAPDVSDEASPVDIHRLAPSREDDGPPRPKADDGPPLPRADDGPPLPEGEETEGDSDQPEEPKWLFSLLKKDEETDGGEG